MADEIRVVTVWDDYLHMPMKLCIPADAAHPDPQWRERMYEYWVRERVRKLLANDNG